MDLYVAAWGIHLPDRVAGTQQAVDAGRYDADDLASAGLTGVTQAGPQAPPDMAVRAAEDCLKRAGADPSDIDLLIHASAFPQGPEMWSPAAYILRELGGADALALEVRQGCNGIFAALEVAAALLRVAPERSTALLTAADNLDSPLVDRWHSAGPAFILGDAACALLLTRGPGFARLRSLRSLTIPELEGMHRGAEPLFPPGAIAGRPIDLAARAAHFSRHTMPLAEATGIVAARQAEIARAALSDADLLAADVTVVVHANAARWLAEPWMEALGLPMSRSGWEIGRHVGHVGSSDQLVCLDRLRATGRLRAGDHVLMMGSAPGFNIAAAVLEVDWQRWRTAHPAAAGVPMLRELLPEPATEPKPAPETARARDEPGPELAAVHGLAGRSTEEYLVGEIATVLGVPVGQVNTRRPLTAQGIDSLMAVELRTRVRRDLNVLLSVSRILGHRTIPELAGDLTAQLTGRPGE